jgi:ribulose bisphosphate carboxylase small subunit
MWRTTVSDQRRRSLSRPHDEQVGTVNLIRARARADLVPRFLLRRGYPITSEHESRRRRKSRRKDHRRQGGCIWDLIQLLYHGMFQQTA